MKAFKPNDIRRVNSSSFGSPGGTVSNADMRNHINLRKTLRIATWNVRGLLQTGKLYIVEHESQRYRVDLLGLAETHWKGSGSFTSRSGNTIYFSGNNENSRNGVAIVVPPKYKNSVRGCNPINDRIIALKIEAKPCVLNLIQVYAPTAESTDEEIETFYQHLESTLTMIPKKELIIVQGDMNAKIGQADADNNLPHIGRYGIGNRNDRGERLLQFCIENNMVLTNTLFQHHIRRLYTWKSPGDRYRNQIDYIMIDSRWKSSVQNTKAFPGAECGSDHQLLAAEVKLRLKNINAKHQQMNLIDERTAQQLKAEINKNLKSEKTNILQHECEIEWTKFKESIKRTIQDDQKNERNRSKRPNKHWMTEHTWKMIEERRDMKKFGTATNKYTTLSREIQRRCRQDKNDYIKNICKEIEEHRNTYQTRDLFKKLNLITRKFKPRITAIDDENGMVLWENERVLQRWKEYCEALYSDKEYVSQPNENNQDHSEEPKIMKEEVIAAIKHLKKNKTSGQDQITAEILHILEDEGIEILLDICNKVWHTGQWPQDWTKSVFIPIHKKGSTKNCENYRTIALISHTSKILLRIIDQRLTHFIEPQIPPEQAGFVKGRGTRDQIFNIRQIIEKAREFNKPLVLCFIDYKKAFDCVQWRSLWMVLKEMGVPGHLIKLITQLYQQSEACVGLHNNISQPFSVERGVRQGCILSPRLFNAYGEYIMNRACNDYEGGVSVGGRTITNLRYADDTTLIANNMEEMQTLLERVTRESKNLGLEINLNKTKLMTIDRGKILPQNNLLNIEEVNEFIYLGSLITNQGDCSKEIRRRISMARTAMTKLIKIWKDRQITKTTKIMLVNSMIFSIFLYGVESWTVKAADRKRIDAFEMWCWRRMLRVAWTERRTNASIITELKIKDRLSTQCRRRILQYFGHTTRREGDNLEKIIVQGKVEGTRPRGRSPSRWIDQVKEITGSSLQALLRETQNRGTWREKVNSYV